MNKSNQTEASTGTNQGILPAEADVMTESKKYQSIFENSMDGILLTVSDGQILQANPAACAMFQMTEKEICETGRLGLVDITDPRLNPLLEERRLQGRAKGEITFIRKDGSKFPGEITSSIFKDASGAETTSLIIRDASANRLAEQKLVATSQELQNALNGLNTVMDSSSDIICTFDEEGKFVHVSAASERILGYLPGELSGRSYLDFVFREDKEPTLRAHVEVKSGVPVTMFENRYVHKDGSIVPILWSSRWNEQDKLSYCIARDATEKKNLEKAVEVEKQRFYDLYSQAPSCMGTLKGPNHVYEMANPLYLQLIDKENIIGKTVKEVLPELEAQGIFEFLDSVYTTGNTFSANEMLVKFDLNGNGKLVDTYLNFIYQAHRDSEGQIDGILFFANNVTEQVLSRNKIEESEKQYRQIVETAQEGIWLIDEENKTTFVNNKMAEILEYSVDEMLGKEIYSFMDEEGKQTAVELMQKKREGYSDERHFKYLSKSGKAIWANVSANPLFKEDGSYKGSLAMVTDITERKQIEQSLASKHESLIEAQAIARVGNWEIDIANNAHYWSDEIYRIFGINKGDVSPSEEAFMSFCHPEDLKFAYERIEEGFRTLQNIIFEFRIIRRDGLVRYAYNQWKFKFDKNGQPDWLFGIFQDVTERKLAEIERAKIVNDLIQRNNDLEQFTYIVSHNLRAPVANILGIENLLNDPGITIEDMAFLRQGLHKSVNGLDRVVKDLSRIIEVKFQINETREKVRFSELVEEIKVSIKNLVERENIEIACDFSAVDEILSLKSYWYSIFYNLVSNSIKYRQQDVPGLIQIQSRRTTDQVELIFSDNGMGIDLKKRGDQVFGLYKRFHLNIEGKGMGLFMVKKQVETLGGKISISSEVNKGTVFNLEFQAEGLF